MTNKIKPFYIKITDDMTPQMVQDAFDKCVDAGADAGDCVTGASSNHEYESGYEFNEYKLFGVRDTNSTRFYDYGRDFAGAQEITLDQLDEWLGLEVEQDWKNGDKCMAFCVECIFIGKSHLNDCDSVIMMNDGTLKHYQTSMLSKPETPEQKAERELYEAIEEGYNLAPDELDIPINQYVAKLLYQQGYRKQ